jgi:hypothetical protein
MAASDISRMCITVNPYRLSPEILKPIGRQQRDAGSTSKGF